MATSLPSVDKRSAQSGDLVFFNINGKVFSHVGIYINGDQFIHAPSQGTGKVTVSSLTNHYWQKRFMGVRRPVLRRAAN
jgi:cell wall-associated NlpC family hydrolase